MDFNNSPKITRRKGACLNCKQRKIRCDGRPTCSQCQKSNIVCSYIKSTPGNVSRRQSVATSCINTAKSSGQATTQGEPRKCQELGERSLQSANESYLDTTGIYAQPSSVDTSLGFDMGSFDFAGIDVGSNISSLPLQKDRNMHDFPNIHSIHHQSLDHGVSYGVDQDWSRAWAEDLCHDFSSLSPLRFLEGHVGDPQLKSCISTISQHFTTNLCHSKKSKGSITNFDLNDSLSAYASQQTAQILNACFTDEYAPSFYISRELIEEILADLIFSPKNVDTYASVLVDAILAIGLTCRNILGSNKSNIARASGYFDRALRKIREEPAGDFPTLIKLQALVTMVIYAKNHQDISVARSLLSQAILTIQYFRSMLPKAPLTAEEIKRQESIECMFWILYSADMQLMIRFGGYPTISDELVMYRAPSKTTNSILCPNSDSARWLVVHYRHARLCSLVVRTLYSNAAVAMTPSETAASVCHLSRILEAWRLSIPVADRPTGCHTMLAEAGNFPWQSGMQLDLFLKYAEAAFAIHRWSMIKARPSGPTDVVEAYSTSQKHCLDISKGIIDIANTFRTDDVEIYWPFVYLPLLSAAFIFMAITKREVGEDHLPYLGIASGYFARLATSGSVFLDLFNGVSHLARIAQCELKNRKDIGSLPVKSGNANAAQGEAAQSEPPSADRAAHSPTPDIDVRHPFIPQPQHLDYTGDSFDASFDLSDPYQFFNDQDFTMNVG